MKEESRRLQRFDLELNAIFISLFINRATWNLIAHAHLYTQNMEAKKEKVAYICEQKLLIIMNIIIINIKAIL